jgi:hypothetical protein
MWTNWTSVKCQRTVTVCVLGCHLNLCWLTWPTEVRKAGRSARSRDSLFGNSRFQVIRDLVHQVPERVPGLSLLREPAEARGMAGSPPAPPIEPNRRPGDGTSQPAEVLLARREIPSLGHVPGCRAEVVVAAQESDAHAAEGAPHRPRVSVFSGRAGRGLFRGLAQQVATTSDRVSCGLGQATRRMLQDEVDRCDVQGARAW